MRHQYINHNRLKKELRNLDETSVTRVLQVVGNQKPVDVIPVDFVKRYAEEQERGGCYQLAIHALLGAWIMEEGQYGED